MIFHSNTNVLSNAHLIIESYSRAIKWMKDIISIYWIIGLLNAHKKNYGQCSLGKSFYVNNWCCEFIMSLYVKDMRVGGD